MLYVTKMISVCLKVKPDEPQTPVNRPKRSAPKERVLGERWSQRRVKKQQELEKEKENDKDKNQPLVSQSPKDLPNADAPNDAEPSEPIPTAVSDISMCTTTPQVKKKTRPIKKRRGFLKGKSRGKTLDKKQLTLPELIKNKLTKDSESESLISEKSDEEHNAKKETANPSVTVSPEKQRDRTKHRKDDKLRRTSRISTEEDSSAEADDEMEIDELPVQKDPSPTNKYKFSKTSSKDKHEGVSRDLSKCDNGGAKLEPLKAPLYSTTSESETEIDGQKIKTISHKEVMEGTLILPHIKQTEPTPLANYSQKNELEILAVQENLKNTVIEKPMDIDENSETGRKSTDMEIEKMDDSYGNMIIEKEIPKLIPNVIENVINEPSSVNSISSETMERDTPKQQESCAQSVNTDVSSDNKESFHKIEDKGAVLNQMEQPPVTPVNAQNNIEHFTSVQLLNEQNVTHQELAAIQEDKQPTSQDCGSSVVLSNQTPSENSIISTPNTVDISDKCNIENQVNVQQTTETSLNTDSINVQNVLNSYEELNAQVLPPTQMNSNIQGQYSRNIAVDSHKTSNITQVCKEKTGFDNSNIPYTHTQPVIQNTIKTNEQIKTAGVQPNIYNAPSDSMRYDVNQQSKQEYTLSHQQRLEYSHQHQATLEYGQSPQFAQAQDISQINQSTQDQLPRCNMHSANLEKIENKPVNQSNRIAEIGKVPPYQEPPKMEEPKTVIHSCDNRSVSKENRDRPLNVNEKQLETNSKMVQQQYPPINKSVEQRETKPVSLIQPQDRYEGCSNAQADKSVLSSQSYENPSALKYTTDRSSARTEETKVEKQSSREQKLTDVKDVRTVKVEELKVLNRQEPKLSERSKQEKYEDKRYHQKIPHEEKPIYEQPKVHMDSETLLASAMTQNFHMTQAQYQQWPWGRLPWGKYYDPTKRDYQYPMIHQFPLDMLPKQSGSEKEKVVSSKSHRHSSSSNQNNSNANAKSKESGKNEIKDKSSPRKDDRSKHKTEQDMYGSIKMVANETIKASSCSYSNPIMEKPPGKKDEHVQHRMETDVATQQHIQHSMKSAPTAPQTAENIPTMGVYTPDSTTNSVHSLHYGQCDIDVAQLGIESPASISSDMTSQNSVDAGRPSSAMNQNQTPSAQPSAQTNYDCSIHHNIQHGMQSTAVPAASPTVNQTPVQMPQNSQQMHQSSSSKRQVQQQRNRYVQSLFYDFYFIKVTI